MIELIKLNSSNTESGTNNAKLQRILNRTNGLNAEILARAETILYEIQARGDAALLEFTERFDGVKLTPETLRVPREVIEELAAQVDDELIAAMRAAIHNIRTYHQHQLTRDWEIERENGVRLGQRVSPLQIVGLSFDRDDERDSGAGRGRRAHNRRHATGSVQTKPDHRGYVEGAGAI
jgi:histidinol dehydrogenase